MELYHVFSWPRYESSGVETDYYGAFDTVESAKSASGLTEIGCIVQVRNSRLWVIAEFDGYPPVWQDADREMGQ